MEYNVFKVIPGYSGYSVNQVGVVKSIARDLVLKQYLLNGYKIVDTFRGSLTETLPVHRAVALAWIPNDDPVNKNVVNHKDGVKTNTHSDNLEWTDYSGNNNHAFDTGLRTDNIHCKVRDFNTGKVFEFNSISKAIRFMGLQNGLIAYLKPKMFGKLLNDRYEFRYKDDPEPWFYEGRTEKVKPHRFQVIVKKPDGTVLELHSLRTILKELQLYKSLDKSIPGLVEYARKVYPDHEFTLIDGYDQTIYRVRRDVVGMPTRVYAVKDDQRLIFDTLTSCAKYFGVDRSTIVKRLGNNIVLDGWTFAK